MNQKNYCEVIYSFGAKYKKMDEDFSYLLFTM
jgi:hypothetical protein